MDSITFQAIKWETTENDDNICIHIHGFTLENKRITVKIPDFKPYIYLELDSKIKWTQSNVELLKSFLKEKMGKNFPIKFKLVEKKKNYYYKTAKFIWMAFNTIKTIKFLENIVKFPVFILGLGKIKLTPHEQRAGAILQLFAMRKIKPAGWIIAKQTTKQQLLDEYPDKFSLSDVEIICSFADLCPANDITAVSNPLIMSYDLECISGDSSGNTFPNPSRITDQVICISATIGNFKDEEDKWKTVCLVNECENKKCSNDINDKSEIRHFNNEKELLLGWRDFINEINPDVITGYNTLSFDDNYIAERAKLLNCWGSFSKIGRIMGLKCEMQERKWSSSAYGDQCFKYLEIPGIIHIDMFPVISKDYTNLQSYTLNSVSEEFLGDHKVDLPAKEMIQRWHRGNLEDICKIVEYCNKDTILPLRLMKHMNTWLGLSEMSNVMMVPMFDLITRGQQIRVFSQVYTLAFELGVVCTEKWADYKPTDEEKLFVGATVQDPQVGYWEKVVTYDFCFSGNTLITLANGLSKRIDKMVNDELVIGYNNNNGINYYNTINGLQIKGEQETIKLTLQYGKTITCTPEHKLMLDDGSWEMAKNLNGKYIKCGIEYPEDTTCDLEKNWSVNFGNVGFNMKEKRTQTLILSRMLGYILSDGSIYKSKNRMCAEVYLGSELDAINFHNDLAFLTNVKVTTKVKDQKYCITLPESISTIIHNIPGIISGKALCLPNFINDTNCPLAIVREFLGGLFGGYGITPCLINNTFSTIKFKCTTIETNEINEIQKVFKNILILLKRFNVNANEITCKIRYIVDIENMRLDHDNALLIDKDSYANFCNKIGFRYCLNKSYKSYIISLYYNYCKEKSPIDFLKDLGIEDWFIKDFGIIKHDTKTIPFFKQKIIDIRNDKKQLVYDIEVENVHNFIANGIVAHNCSLYPTTIIAYNLCFSTFVPNDENPPLEDYHDLKWEEHSGCFHDKSVRKTKPTKIICGSHQYRFYKANIKKGIVPMLLEQLLEARANTRKELKNLQKKVESGLLTESELKDAKLLLIVLDKRQNGYKVSANSAYGGFGSDFSYTPFYPAAASTTAMGRESIQKAITFAKNYRKDTVLVYGDSVTFDTPVLLRDPNGKTFIQQISLLGSDQNWEEYTNFKSSFLEPINSSIEYHVAEDGGEALMAARHLFHNGKCWSKQKKLLYGWEVWTETGWSKIKKVIRHKTAKKIYRITTHTGTVDVTQDHSLLDENCNQIKPSNVKIGDKLLHNYPSIFNEEIPIVNFNRNWSEIFKECGVCKKTRHITDYGICRKGHASRCRACRMKNSIEYISEYEYFQPFELTEQEAEIWGLFMADGSCGDYNCKSGHKISWAINNQDIRLLQRIKQYLELTEPFNFVIMDTLKSSGVYKLVPRGKFARYLTSKYSIMYDATRAKIVPTVVLNAPKNIRKAFWMGYYSGDGYRKVPYMSLAAKNKVSTQTLWYLARTLGYTNMHLNTRSDKPNIFRIQAFNGKQRIEPTVIKKIDVLGVADEYVYDLETESGHFQAGIGELIVKNTDSCMLHFTNIKDLKECFKVCEELEHDINKIFPKPMYLEMEKIYSKYFLLSKKRYIGHIVDENNKLLKIDKKGVVSKRRDNCSYLRDTFNSLIDMVMQKEPKWKMYDYISDRIDNLLKGNVNLEELVITKSIKDNYKNENLPHLAVSKKMTERGKYVTSGTRIRYIFTKTDGTNDPQYVKAEDPDYYLENPDTVAIDYLYYFEKQLINPIDEVLEVKFGVKNVLSNLFKLIKKERLNTANEYFTPKFIVKD